jgi:hypothetical protein
MSLADEIKKMSPPNKQLTPDAHEQLSMVDEIENILRKLGVTLETRFEIPLSRRINSRQTEKNA